MYCHDLEVMGSNPCLLKVRVRRTVLLSKYLNHKYTNLIILEGNNTKWICMEFFLAVYDVGGMLFSAKT